MDCYKNIVLVYNFLSEYPEHIVQNFVKLWKVEQIGFCC